MAGCGDIKNKSELRIFESLDELVRDFAEYIAEVSEASVKERGAFSVALSGRSVISLMRKLCETPYNKTVDWKKWHVFWADERAVSKNHVDSNYRLTKDGFLFKNNWHFHLCWLQKVWPYLCERVQRRNVGSAQIVGGPKASTNSPGTTSSEEIEPDLTQEQSEQYMESYAHRTSKCHNFASKRQKTRNDPDLESSRKALRS